MEIRVDQSELFDRKSTRYNNGHWDPNIGIESTWHREIISDIPVQVLFWVKMPANKAGKFPTIARVNFSFNGQWFQFRNIKTKEWTLWEGLKHELGL